MTLALPEPAPTITVGADTIAIDGLLVHNAEAASIVRTHAAEHGPHAMADLLGRAIPIGLVALSLSSARMDSAALQRTLDHFASDVDQRSTRALSGLEDVLNRLRAGERQIEQAARNCLAQLPEKLDAVLAGEAQSVRAAVATAAREVHTAALDEMRRALDQHATSVRSAISTDSGPMQTLRRDLLVQIDSTRRELAEQLTTVRELLAAAEASKPLATKSSRAVGADFEAVAMELAEEIVTAAGDRWEATGSQPGNGTSRRVGDGVALLNSAITSRRPVRIVVEAKHRTRPLTAKSWREELAEARTVREAAGALAIVPNADQVPGSNGFCRVDEAAFVVAADQNVGLVYQVLREVVALATVGQQDAEIDLAKVEAQLNVALAGLTDLDEMGRLVNAATKSLATAREVGGRVKARIHEALTAGLAALHA